MPQIFGIRVTSNLVSFRLALNFWNFELTMFELIIKLNIQKIGKLPSFGQKFELSGTSN